MNIEFRNLQKLLDYIPNCLICKKEMVLSMEGRLARVKDNKKPKRWDDGGTWITLRTRAKNELIHDDLLHFRNTKYLISVSPNNNKIIKGLEIAQRFRFLKVDKVCRTCEFKIQSVNIDRIGSSTYFPRLELERELLKFTMAGGKSVEVYRLYIDAGLPLTPTTVREVFTKIIVDKRELPPLPLEFTKIKDINHLTRKIKTAIVFQ